MIASVAPKIKKSCLLYSDLNITLLFIGLILNIFTDKHFQFATYNENIVAVYILI